MNSRPPERTVLQLICSTGFFGAERMLLELSRGLRGAGDRVVIAQLSLNAGGRPEVIAKAAAEGFEVRELPCGGRMRLSTLRALRKLVRDEKVDVIHSHGYKSDFYAALATLGGPRTGLVATCHNWPGRGWKMDAYKTLDKLLLRRFRRIAAVSGRLERELLAAGLGRRRVARIWNGIGTAAGRRKRELRSAFGLDGDGLLVGAVGRLSPEKGYPDLFKAARMVTGLFPKTRFVIVGDGPDDGLLRRQRDEMGLAAAVTFAGRRDDMPSVYAALDVFVMPSLTEGMPMALLEAMAAGLPVVATKVGEIPAILDGGAGILVEPGDPTGLAAALMKLAADRELAAGLGCRAAARVRQKFSSERMTAAYRVLYRAAAARSRWVTAEAGEG